MTRRVSEEARTEPAGVPASVGVTGWGTLAPDSLACAAASVAAAWCQSWWRGQPFGRVLLLTRTASALQSRKRPTSSWVSSSIMAWTMWLRDWACSIAARRARLMRFTASRTGCGHGSQMRSVHCQGADTLAAALRGSGMGSALLSRFHGGMCCCCPCPGWTDWPSGCERAGMAGQAARYGLLLAYG